MADPEADGKELLAGAKHLGSGKLRHPLRSSPPFHSLSNTWEDTTAINSPTLSKYSKRYAVGLSSSSEQEKDANVLSNTPRASISTSSSKQKHCKSKPLSADDFVGKLSVAKQQQNQPVISSQSGEGHCSGSCALIPVDIRPLVKQAYEGSDFCHVDPSPVFLPMLCDDGVLRRDLPKTD